jgi:hypothetical protein
VGDDVTRGTPPRSATWLLGVLLSEADKDAVIGDLIEEHALRHSQSGRRGSWWYWSQVARSVLPFFWIAIRRERWLGILGAAITAYLLATIIESAATIEISRLFTANALPQERMGLLIGLSAMALGGYTAAWIRRGAAAALAVIIALMVVALMVTMSESVPLWSQLGFLVFGPLASLAGGALWRRRQCKKRVF